MKVKKEKYCISCGKAVSGRTKKCKECKETEKLHACLSCGKMIRGRNRKCQDCLDKEREEGRWKTCSICGDVFRLKDHQGGGNKICHRCKDAKYKIAYNTIMTFFADDNPLDYLPMPVRIREFASSQRNIIQDTTGYSEFKITDVKFESVPPGSQTWDHVNSMTYFIERYITDCLADPAKKNFTYFREYFLKYAVQFRVTPQQNIALIPFQKIGIRSYQYISVVGKIIGKTIDESIEIVKPHFING